MTFNRLALRLPAKCVSFFSLLFISGFFFTTAFAQTSTWVGSVSTDYFTKTNWSDPTMDWANLTAWTLQIVPGAPNNPVLNGGNNSNVNYRPARINTFTGSVFTVNGAVYPNNNDSLNGTVILNSGADFNIRNIAYIGNKANAVVNINGGALTSKNGMYIATGSGGSATVTVAGGSLNAGSGGANMDLNLANGTGLTAQMNITGGSVKIARNLNIGTNGKIYISGLGLLQIAGDKVAQLNGLVADGRLSCTPGKTLTVAYNGTNTQAYIPQNPNSMIREYGDSVVLQTGDLVCVLEKWTGNVVSYRYKGVETVANKSSDTKKYMYHDFTTSYGFETIWGCTYEVVEDGTDIAHVVFKRPYTPGIGHVTPCDAELHYALKKDDKGVYVYSKLEHKPAYPKFDMGSWRQVWWIAKSTTAFLTENIYTDSLRSWQMNAPNDSYDATGIAEIKKFTSGVRAGKFDGKYEYSLRFLENPVWGHASNVNNIGIWCVNASGEYYDEGPLNNDLNSAEGIIHQCMNGVHYGDRGMEADIGTSWTKVFGPYLLLITDKATAGENWVAARQRQAVEAAQWPYSWVKDNAAYPLSAQRGSVSGKFVLNDVRKPSVTGNGFWIGVTDVSDLAAGTGNNFQFESKNYQYWVKVDAAGNFTIPNVRPGTYSLFAFGDGAVGEYRLDNVQVTAGSTTDLGTLTRTIDRSYGPLVFEIGLPNRMANEFKMGDFDYCEGFVERKFRDSFPATIEYNTVDNNWSTALPYAHTKYPDEAFNPTGTWKWRLNFTLPAGVPATGNARLTIAYASNDHAQQWIYVNNENSTFTTYYPDNGDGNAFIRQANFAKYSYKEVLIPMSKLKAGLNTITLVMPSNSAWVSHLMYDYISLEAPTGVLPVTYLSFTAKATPGRQAALSWLTASEKNNSHFVVEKSRDALTFTPLGTVQKQAGATGNGSYAFTDPAPFTGRNFYRLKQVDVDGRYDYSPVREVSFGANKFDVYPNPVADVLHVRSSGSGVCTVELYNAEGKLVLQKKAAAAAVINLPVAGLPPGLYLLKLFDGESIWTEKIRKQ